MWHHTVGNFYADQFKVQNQTRILSMSAVGPLHVDDFCQSTANAVAKIFTQQTSAVFISHQDDW